MNVSNAVFAALAGFLTVFAAQVLGTAPNPIAQAWGWVLVVAFASAMVYMMRSE